MGTQGRSRWAKALAVAAAALLAQGTTLHAQQEGGVPPAIERAAGELATLLAEHCPLAPANDIAAFERCREGLRTSEALRARLPQIVLWGRQPAAAQATLAATTLTQFAPEVWTQLYAPLFMFNGRYRLQWVPQENQYVLRLEAAFRNRLPPGQYPTPFWHDAQKWATYQHANGVLLWLQPQTGRVHVAQVTNHAGTRPLQEVETIARRFEGQWLWTDDGGRMQPAVTAFDGMYRPENPFLPKLDRQYRDLALHLREAQCTQCHTPDNPQHMQRQVLLATPAHAAGEIDRLIRAVREDRMPMDANRRPVALSAEAKTWLLQSATAFRDTVRAAREWESPSAQGAAAASDTEATE
jgi:hypothetical protein